MRKTRTIKIDDREITIKELRVKDIRRLMDKASGDDFSLTDVPNLLPAITDLEPAALEDMAPSELKTLWEAFREVNAVFFDLAAKAGIGKEITRLIRSSLTDAFAGLSNADTSTPPNTASGSS